MTIIRTVPEVEATGEFAAIYADEVESLGYVPPHTKVMATNAAAYRAFEALIQSVAVPLGLRRYELGALQALAVDVDVPERLSEPVRSALVEGL